MGDLHINSPKPTNQSFRLLPKYCRKFIDKKFKSLKKAFNYGLLNYQDGFRVFKQSCFEWYDPENEEIIKVGKVRILERN